MVVDGESDNSTIFKIALEDDGFEVDAFNDPTLALSAFKPDFYDLLILDIKMPKMNGYELYEKIKKIDDKVKVCFPTDTILKSSKQGFSFHLLLIIYVSNP